MTSRQTNDRRADAGFATPELRRVVLAAWTASPARFREDANAEEELARGAYRDRLVIELAQNAADAAARAGRPGDLLFELTEGQDGAVLVAANTGAALDRAGVEALSSLRTSTKRDDAASTGRFGVGFAAVLAVTDAPEIHSLGGAVAWSADRTRDAVGAVPALAAELARRGGQAPVLRLPEDIAARPVEGYDTAVVLPVRDAAALTAVRGMLADVDDVLLLALPALARLQVRIGDENRVLTSRQERDAVIVADGLLETRWRLVTRSGPIAADLVADRPVEERARASWSLTWAVPVTPAGIRPLPPATRAVVHAPTPTDDPLDLPALLLATFGLDSSRRHVAPGPLRDFLVAAAGSAYAELVAALAAEDGLTPGAGALAMLPAGVPAGELDAALRRAIDEALAETPFVPAASAGRRLRPRDAVLIAEAGAELIAVLAPVLDDLAAAGWASPALTRLGARTLTIADVVAELDGLRREPAWWRELYDALSGVDVEALRGLPVPLADGRLVRDPRDVLLPVGAVSDASEPGTSDERERTSEAVATKALLALGLRVADPAAAHPLLERLGAQRASPAGVLAHPSVRALVASLVDAEPDEQIAVARAVLTLVAAAAPQTFGDLAELPLPDSGGEPTAAGELLLPDGALRAILAPGVLGVVCPDLVAEFGAAALAAIGVLESFAVVRAADVPADPDGCDHDLDGELGWLEQVEDALGPAGGAPELIVELVAVRDLDLVDPGAWPGALRLLAAPPLRAAVTEPARIRRADGRVVDVPSYTAWWLRTHPVLGGRRPLDLRLPGSDPRLDGLWDTAPVALDPEFARALGLRNGLDEVLASPGGAAELLTRLGSPDRAVGRAQLGAIYAALARVDADDADLGDAPPERVRVPDGAGTAVVPAGDVMIAHAPDLLPLLAGRRVIAAPGEDAAAALADVLAVALAADEPWGAVASAGSFAPVPAAARRALAGAPRPCPETYSEHEALLLHGPHGQVEVDWRWVDGILHAATADGLAAGLAWAAGSWERRWLVAAALAAPDRVDDLLLDEDFSARPDPAGRSGG